MHEVFFPQPSFRTSFYDLCNYASHDHTVRVTHDTFQTNLLLYSHKQTAVVALHLCSVEKVDNIKQTKSLYQDLDLTLGI